MESKPQKTETTASVQTAAGNQRSSKEVPVESKAPESKDEPQTSKPTSIDEGPDKKNLSSGTAKSKNVEPDDSSKRYSGGRRTSITQKFLDDSINSLRKKVARGSVGSLVVSSSLTSVRTDAESKKQQNIKYMNTYRLDSKQPFSIPPVTKIIRDVFDTEFEGMVYEPIIFAKCCGTLAAEIRTRVKSLGFERYKLVCVVQICEKNQQSVNSIAKFIWDADRDKCASYTYDSGHFLACGAVFGLYYE